MGYLRCTWRQRHCPGSEQRFHLHGAEGHTGFRRRASWVVLAVLVVSLLLPIQFFFRMVPVMQNLCAISAAALIRWKLQPMSASCVFRFQKPVCDGPDNVPRSPEVVAVGRRIDRR